jgi:hypothetical protein
MKPLYKTNCRLLLPFFIILMSLTSYHANAKSMGINSSAITPDALSILEMKTTTRGLLIRRTTGRDAISSLATGLMIYNTAASKSFRINSQAATGIYYVVIVNEKVKLSQPVFIK